MHVVSSIDTAPENRKVIENAKQQLERVGEGELDVVHINSKNIEYNGKNIISKQEANPSLQQFRMEFEKPELKYNLKSIEKEDDKSKIDTLLDYCDEEDVQQIYVGHRRLDTKTEYYVGSFAKELLQKTTIPVTVVPIQ